MIMIVDDNAPVRGIIRQYVRNIYPTMRNDIYECNDGVEAVDAYHRLHPEWVLMDIKMPNMDGLTAMKAIRRQFPAARIIIVTNFGDPELRDEAKQNGAAGYVLKERLWELKGLMHGDRSS